MGAKRPLEEQDFPELSFKQPKQTGCDTLHADDFPSNGTTMTEDSLGVAKSNFCKIQLDETPENGEADGAFEAEHELELSVPLSLVTSSGSEGDAGNEDSGFWSYFPEYVNFREPRRPLEQFEDPYVRRPPEQFEYPYIRRSPEQYEDRYVSLLNCSPRKEVLVGPNHQAEVPEWDQNARMKYFSSSNRFFEDEREQKLMGTCVIPMPDLDDSTIDAVTVGRGRADCSCLDVGSMRCVKQHVKEARENLGETLGEDKFRKLGFFDMGEEVANKWTTDDERAFHEVIYNNTVSLGRNFWMHLSAVFPTRTKMEIVSYYFNVFILRRRAVQNRTYLLEIDSDDDEELEGTHGDFYRSRSYVSEADIDDRERNYDDHQGIHGGSYVVSREDEDSTVDSFCDQELDVDWINDDSWSEPENIRKDEDRNDTQGTSDWNVPKEDAVEMDGGRDELPGQGSMKLLGESSFDS